jgi:hypothetical protein
VRPRWLALPRDRRSATGSAAECCLCAEPAKVGRSSFARRVEAASAAELPDELIDDVGDIGARYGPDSCFPRTVNGLSEPTPNAGLVKQSCNNGRAPITGRVAPAHVDPEEVPFHRPDGQSIRARGSDPVVTESVSAGAPILLGQTHDSLLLLRARDGGAQRSAPAAAALRGAVGPRRSPGDFSRTSRRSTGKPGTGKTAVRTVRRRSGRRSDPLPPRCL